MLKIDLEVKARETGTGAKNVNQLRREGWVPAVMYGHGEPVKVVVSGKSLKKVLHSQSGSSALFNIKLADKSETSIIKEIQRDMFTREPIHIDFQRISATEKIEVTVPVHLIGEANGVKNQGGILEHIQRDIRIKCLPADLISSVDVDIAALNLHDAIRVSDLKTSSGIEILTPHDHIVVHVVAPRVEEAKPAPGAVEGAAAQPEVISKGKKDEEGAAAPAAGAASAAPADKGDKKK